MQKHDYYRVVGYKIIFTFFFMPSFDILKYFISLDKLWNSFHWGKTRLGYLIKSSIKICWMDKCDPVVRKMSKVLRVEE